MNVRVATAADVDDIVTLWRKGGVDHDSVQDRHEIVAKLDVDGDLFLVLHNDDGALVGSVMGTYDGHRGRIKRAVVDPDCQGAGIGRRLVRELERRFLQRGITELRLEVWASNTGALAFWTEMGWEHLQDLSLIHI